MGSSSARPSNGPESRTPTSVTSVMGQVLQGGAGQAPSRQATVAAGLPVELPSDTINKVCASSIRAIEIADLMIRTGEHDVVVAGGMESMTNAPYALEEGALRLPARRRDADRPDRPRRADFVLRPPAHDPAGVVRLPRARHRARGPGPLGAALARARGQRDRQPPVRPGDRPGRRRLGGREPSPRHLLREAGQAAARLRPGGDDDGGQRSRRQRRRRRGGR